MSALRELKDEIAWRMRRGEAFATVEDEVIDRNGLSEAEQSALWLYGWSFVDARSQREEALAHLEKLAEHRASAHRARAGLRAVGTD